MGLHPLLMMDVKVYYSQQKWVYNLCYQYNLKNGFIYWLWHPPLAIKGSKHILVDCNNVFITPFANDWCQSLLQSTKMSLHPLQIVDHSWKCLLLFESWLKYLYLHTEYIFSCDWNMNSKFQSTLYFQFVHLLISIVFLSKAKLLKSWDIY